MKANEHVLSLLFIVMTYLYFKEGPFNSTNEWEKFIIASLWDLKIVENFMAVRTDKLADIESSVFRIMNQKFWPIILRYYRINEGSISVLRSKLKLHLVNVISEECLEFLQNVEAIPRLYRRTNRFAPREASSYMPEAVKPILNLHNMFTEFLEQDMKDILERVIVKVTNRLVVYTFSVLISPKVYI